MKAKPRFGVSCFITAALHMLALSPSLADDTSKAISETLRPNIIDGTPVKKGEYTSVVALRMRLDNSPFCTGSVVADRWILTATHCFKDLSPDDYYLSTGLGPGDGRGFAEERRVDYPNQTFDATLIKVKYQISSSTVVPATLQRPPPQLNILVTAVGWGEDPTEPGLGDRLMKVNLTLISTTCQDGSHICAKDRTGRGRGTSYGDSGGPLFATTTNGNEYQIGVSRGGYPKVAPTLFVFVPASGIYDWVQTEINAPESPGARSAQ